MSWTVVARKDVRDAVRSRALWAMIAVFVAVSTMGVYLPTLAFEDVTPGLALSFLAAPIKAVTALTALVAGYAAVAGERDSGSLKLLLALPHTRADVVAGKFVGRGVVVSAALVVAFGAVAIVLFALTGGIAPAFPAFAIAALLYGIAFVAIAVGLSAALATRTRAAAAAVGSFLAFDLVWGLLPRAAYYLRYGTLPAEELPAWYILLDRLSPMRAYDVLTRAVLGGVDRGITVSSTGVRAGTAGVTPLADRLAGPAPFYLDDWFGSVVLLAWLAVPLALGYLRFRTVDL